MAYPIYQPHHHFWQMLSTDYMPSLREKAAFWEKKFEPMGGSAAPTYTHLNPLLKKTDWHWPPENCIPRQPISKAKLEIMQRPKVSMRIKCEIVKLRKCYFVNIISKTSAVRFVINVKLETRILANRHTDVSRKCKRERQSDSKRMVSSAKLLLPVPVIVLF